MQGGLYRCELSFFLSRLLRLTHSRDGLFPFCWKALLERTEARQRRRGYLFKFIMFLTRCRGLGAVRTSSREGAVAKASGRMTNTVTHSRRFSSARSRPIKEVMGIKAISTQGRKSPQFLPLATSAATHPAQLRTRSIHSRAVARVPRLFHPRFQRETAHFPVP